MGIKGVRHLLKVEGVDAGQWTVADQFGNSGKEFRFAAMIDVAGRGLRKDLFLTYQHLTLRKSYIRYTSAITLKAQYRMYEMMGHG
jgi:hypothetical protein